MNRIVSAPTLIVGLLAWSAMSPAAAQYACTTDYCIQSQSLSFETPPGWPTVTVEHCCATHWGTRPGSIDWNKGAPIMICTATPEFVTAFPNCGDPRNMSQAFPLSYDKPKFAVGVTWPDPNEYRYELQSVPIIFSMVPTGPAPRSRSSRARYRSGGSTRSRSRSRAPTFSPLRSVSGIE